MYCPLYNHFFFKGTAGKTGASNKAKVPAGKEYIGSNMYMVDNMKSVTVTGYDENGKKLGSDTVSRHFISTMTYRLLDKKVQTVYLYLL